MRQSLCVKIAVSHCAPVIVRQDCSQSLCVSHCAPVTVRQNSQPRSVVQLSRMQVFSPFGDPKLPIPPCPSQSVPHRDHSPEPHAPHARILEQHACLSSLFRACTLTFMHPRHCAGVLGHCARGLFRACTLTFMHPRHCAGVLAHCARGCGLHAAGVCQWWQQGAAAAAAAAAAENGPVWWQGW